MGLWGSLVNPLRFGTLGPRFKTHTSEKLCEVPRDENR